MNIRIRDFDIRLLELCTRMPFRYGIATMTRVPQAFVRLGIELGGTHFNGIAADLLPPKWFTKVPETPLADEVAEMLRVIRHAAEISVGLRGDSAFDVWWQLYAAQRQWGDAERLPPLLTNFGTSLVERALIEAVCRAAGRPFSEMLRANQLGIRLGEIHQPLDGLSPADFLPARPLNEIIARHTIGLADPLTDADIAPGERLNDGLPQSLADCIRTYGLRHFKVKVNGDLDRDRDRLRRVAEIIHKNAGADYAFSLDGNEQFKSAAEFRGYWETIAREAVLKDFLRKLLFVEQPLHRDVALSASVADALRDWPDHPPIIIDESDATLESLSAALALGYAGTSHKNCKGVFKGVGHRCLLLKREREGTGAPALMSGEDLCNIGPVALQQDLAVMAALGIRSVERNGHHYCAGLSMFPEKTQKQVLETHHDLYRASVAGWPTLDIVKGVIRLDSINAAPLGVGFALDLEPFFTVCGADKSSWHSSAPKQVSSGCS